MSKQYVVLTAVGADRPGLVKEVSSVIHAAGCNLEDSRMAVLAGAFALIVLLSGEPAAVDRVWRQCASRLEAELGLRVAVEPTEPARPRPDHLVRRLIVQGADQPGIVHRVGEALARQDVNVATLESRVDHAAFSGTALFTLVAELQVPGDDELSGLHAELDQICERLDLSYSLDET